MPDLQRCRALFIAWLVGCAPAVWADDETPAPGSEPAPAATESAADEPGAAAEASPDAASESVRALTADLGSDDYFTRESAMKRLVGEGQSAVAPLAAAAQGDSFEVTCRAIQVLRALAVGDDLPAAEAAHQALAKLADSPATSAAQRAETALRYHRLVRADRARAEVLRLGGIIGPESLATQVHNPNQLLIGKQWQGNEDSLAHLKWLAGISWLSIYNVPVGDSALPHLKQLPFLTRLELYGTKISDDALNDLRAALPNTVIDRRNGALLGVQGNRMQNICQVSLVQPGSAADAAGVQPGDIIRKFDGQAVQTFEDLTALIATKQGGDKVALEVHRGDQMLTLEAVLGEWK